MVVLDGGKLTFLTGLGRSEQRDYFLLDESVYFFADGRGQLASLLLLDDSLEETFFAVSALGELAENYLGLVDASEGQRLERESFCRSRGDFS